MNNITFSELVIYFAIYSLIGWLCEFVFGVILKKRFINCGFLTGPYCPIYGFGAILIIFLLQSLRSNIAFLPIVFIGAFIISGMLEYFAGWSMEKVFRIKWWDYSKRKLNIHGRVCLANSLIFAAAGTILLYILHPQTQVIVNNLSYNLKTVLSSLFLSLILVDVVATINNVYKLDEKLKKVQIELNLFKTTGESIDKQIEESGELNNLLQKDESGRRLLAAFENAKHDSMQESLELVCNAYKNKKGVIEEAFSKIKDQFKKPKDKSDKSDEFKPKSFASGLNFYKFFWIFFISCIVGYVVETIYCLFKLGYVESRQGLIYGPFSQIYGFGAVLMVAALSKLQKKRDTWIFIGSAVIGGVFEFICSLIQEKAFGSNSWDYANQSFSFGGRTSLLFMFFWGILGVLLMKEIYPRLSRFIERIPNRQGIIISWILIVFMAANMLISAMAVTRWSSRILNKPAQNAIEHYLDEKYPNSFLEMIYPNMNFVIK